MRFRKSMDCFLRLLFLDSPGPLCEIGKVASHGTGVARSSTAVRFERQPQVALADHESLRSPVMKTLASLLLIPTVTLLLTFILFG